MGRLRDYPVLHLNSVTERLGPVKAPSFRQASRVANTIRAGQPVHRFEEFSYSEIILLCVPASKTNQLVTELASTKLNWKRKTVLLCCNLHGSEILGPLAALGASVGSLALISEADDRRFLTEGDRMAVRLARLLIEEDGGQVVEVLAGAKQLCQAAFSFSSWLLQPLMDASVECFRNAGLTPGRAGTVADLVLQEAVRSYLKAGRRAWRPPRSVGERQAFLRQLDDLGRTNPDLEDFMRTTAIQSLRHMRRSHAWLEKPKPLVRRAAAGD